MDLEAMIDGMSAMSRPMKTTKAILTGQVDKIEPEDLEEFATQVLAPVRGELQELLDRPRLKDLWRHGLVKTPRGELEAVLNCKALDASEAYTLIAEAMLVSAGKGQEAPFLWHARGVVRGYYESPKASMRGVFEKYVDADAAQRSDMWITDFMRVGCVNIIDTNKARILPLADAAKAAANFLLKNKFNGDALGPEGGVIQFCSAPSPRRKP